MKISRWLLYDDNLDKYSIIEVSKLLKTFLGIIPLVAVVLSIVNFSLGFWDIAVTILTVPFFCLLSFLALRKGMINLSIIILISILIAANTLACVLGNGVHETGIIVLPVIILFSSLVLNVRGVVVTTITVILCLAYIVFGEKYGLYPSRNVPSVRWVDLVVVETIIVIHIFVTYTFSNITKKNLQRVKIEFKNQEKYKEEIKNNLNEKSELLRLVHHRVKNNLLLINSLVDLESYGKPNSKEGLSEVTSSISTIARAHDPLYHTEDYKQVEIKPYLEKLISNLAQNAGTPEIQCEIENCFVFHQKALLLGVLIQKIPTKMIGKKIEIIIINLSYKDRVVTLQIKADDEHHLVPRDLVLEELLIERLQGRLEINEQEIVVTLQTQV